MIRILLADDQVLFVNSLKAVLMVKDHELCVKAVVYNGEDAIKFLQKNNDIDVAVLDIRMEPLDGVRATKIIREAFPHVKVIMLTTFDDDKYVVRAMDYGASGYLLKDMLPEEFIAAIRVVAGGGSCLSPSVVKSLIKPRTLEKPSWFMEMSDKERQILRLLSFGHNNEEIAFETFLGKQTVKNYIHNIYDKMGVRDRMHALRLCIELKLFED